MLHRKATDVQEWKTVYEDVNRKILARGDERRAIDVNTGEIITEYNVVTTAGT